MENVKRNKNRKVMEEFEEEAKKIVDAIPDFDGVKVSNFKSTSKEQSKSPVTFR